MWSEMTKDLNGTYDVDDSVTALIRTEGPVITVNGADKQGRPYDFKENATVFGQKISSQLSANTQSLLRLLSGDNKVQNNILKFTPDQVN